MSAFRCHGGWETQSIISPESCRQFPTFPFSETVCLLSFVRSVSHAGTDPDMTEPDEAAHIKPGQKETGCRRTRRKRRLMHLILWHVHMEACKSASPDSHPGRHFAYSLSSSSRWIFLLSRTPCTSSRRRRSPLPPARPQIRRGGFSAWIRASLLAAAGWGGSSTVR